MGKEAPLNSVQQVDLPEDSLNHEALAASLLSYAEYSKPGTIIALQGSWGRGKTDVLKRIEAVLSGSVSETFIENPIWLNPWQYGTADLLTPIVIELINRIKPRKRSGARALRKAAESLLRAGTAIGFKAASIVAPAGGLFDAASKPADALIKGLFEALEVQEQDQPQFDHDPIAVMSKRFRELVDEFLKFNDSLNKRIVVCVDDIDRCLPDRQVAMLEALHFLTSANVKAIFFVAIDPTLAKQAILTHFGTKHFDPDRYLDKLFTIRANLPSLSLKDIKNFVERSLDSKASDDKQGVSFETLCRQTVGDLKSEAIQNVLPLFQLPDFNNPRIMQKIFNRIDLIARHGIKIRPEIENDDEYLRNFFLWIVLAERYPSIRSAMQLVKDEKSFFNLFNAIHEYYFDPVKNRAKLDANVISNLPDPEFVPDIPVLFGGFIIPGTMAKDFYKFDQLLKNHGL